MGVEEIFVILQALTFVDYHAGPLDLSEEYWVLDRCFVRGDNDMSSHVSAAFWEELIVHCHVASFPSAIVGNDTNIRGPLLDLPTPVWAGGIWSNDEEWPALSFSDLRHWNGTGYETYLWLVLYKSSNESNNLDRLSKTHFIGEDNILLVMKVV
jgi:hypothetical protein